MITEASVVGQLLYEGVSAAEFVRPAFEGAAQQSVHPQTYFGDEEVRAALDFSRSVSRLFILLCVSLSVLYMLYGCFLLVVSGGEPRKLEQSRTVFKNVGVGLVVSISSYLIISTALALIIQTVGLPDTVSFWDDSVFEDEFGIYRLLDDTEYALEGEVLILDGGTAIICEAGLLFPAREVGWTYQTNLWGTSVNGCLNP